MSHLHHFHPFQKEMDGLHGFWWRRFFSYVPTLRQCTRHRITLVHSLPPWKRNSQMEKKHRNISLEVIGVLMGMSLHREPKLRCCNKTKTKHTSFAPPPRQKMPRETGPCWKENNLPTNVFGGYVSFLGSIMFMKFLRLWSWAKSKVSRVFGPPLMTL